LELLFDIDIKPAADRFPKILLIDLTKMQTTKEYPAFFKVVNVEFDILPDDFK
jgi:hypothetical protein